MNTDTPIQRVEFFVTNQEAMNLFVREIRWRNRLANGDRPPILLVHGARVPGVPSFDLPVQGGSLAEDLAQAGHTVYLMDVRGYGYSERPEEMEDDPAIHSPLVRVREAMRDIEAVVETVSERVNCDTITLLGWATGGMWCGYYATAHPERVSHLILYNTLYQSPGHPSLGAGSTLESPEKPGQFNQTDIGAYRFNSAASLLGGWDSSIPVEDKSQWRDPAVATAYVEAALASDITSQKRNPPSFRAPSGALEDSFYQATGRQLWDASLIQSQTLIIASENDFWSQLADRERLQQHLVHAPYVRTHVIPNATHFVHLDRPECGRTEFLDKVLRFLTPDVAGPASSARSAATGWRTGDRGHGSGSSRLARNRSCS